MKKLKNYVKRDKSVLTNKVGLKHLYTLKDFPVFFGCVDSPQKEDLFLDMVWEIEPDTGMIQLTKLVPLDVLYQAQHVDGCGPTWQTYYDDFAKYILESCDPMSVLEIGGGQGQLADTVTEKKSKLKWTIVEPNPTHSGNSQITIIPKFFDENFRFAGKVNAVVFSQLLEHIYYPDDFVKVMSSFLKPGGKLVFAYPNLTVWLKRKYTNALNFEHTMFLTNVFVDYMLQKHGFKITDKRKYKDHSYFYTVEKLKVSPKDVVLESRYKEYKKIFNEFTKHHEELVRDLNNKMKAAEDPVYCFGAHIFTSYLFSFGLNDEKIVTILDNSPTKRGKRLYGTRFVVESPKVLKGKGKVNLILKAGIYNDEIKKDILDNINPDVVFW